MNSSEAATRRLCKKAQRPRSATASIESTSKLAGKSAGSTHRQQKVVLQFEVSMSRKRDLLMKQLRREIPELQEKRRYYYFLI